MNITPANLGWGIAAFLIAGYVLGSVQSWAGDRWEFTGRRLPVRRWYGTGARVCLGSNANQVFRVISWSDEGTEVPWLLVVLHSGTSWYIDEPREPQPRWMPVTSFAPGRVRRFRPHLERVGGVRVPWLTAYLPVGGAR